MARVIPESEFTILLEIIARHPGGISISGLLAHADCTGAKRTVQRRIDTLLQSGHIKAEGDDRERFCEIIQIELNSLHEGNIARYRLRPKELVAWQQVSLP